MGVVISLGIIIFTGLLICYLSNYFTEASSKIGDYLHLPRSVKGATFDAIGSSLPELFVALFSVVFFQKFEVGIGTITGSALFNLLIIPGLCVLVAPGIFRISKEVISRDAIFYVLSVFVLLTLVLYFKTWGFAVAFILLIIYVIYLKKIVGHAKLFRKVQKESKKVKKMDLSKEVIIFVATLLLIGIATYFLLDSSIDLSYTLGISPVIIAFTITAAATSLPDTVISVLNAKKGNVDDATSNVFGSNIFDILVGLGLPLLIYVIYKGSLQIVFEHLEIIMGLLGATILLLYFFAQEHRLTKKQGWILLFMYFLFIIYVLYISLL